MFSALHPTSDIEGPRRHVHFVPNPDVEGIYSMIASGMESNAWGTTSPSALAVFVLITNSYCVGCWIARLSGFSPFRMRSTYLR